MKLLATVFILVVSIAVFFLNKVTQGLLGRDTSNSFPRYVKYPLFAILIALNIFQFGDAIKNLYVVVSDYIHDLFSAQPSLRLDQSASMPSSANAPKRAERPLAADPMTVNNSETEFANLSGDGAWEQLLYRDAVGRPIYNYSGIAGVRTDDAIKIQYQLDKDEATADTFPPITLYRRITPIGYNGLRLSFRVTAQPIPNRPENEQKCLTLRAGVYTVNTASVQPTEATRIDPYLPAFISEFTLGITIPFCHGILAEGADLVEAQGVRVERHRGPHKNEEVMLGDDIKVTLELTKSSYWRLSIYSGGSEEVKEGRLLHPFTSFDGIVVKIDQQHAREFLMGAFNINIYDINLREF